MSGSERHLNLQPAGSNPAGRLDVNEGIFDSSSEPEADYKDVLGFSAVFMMYLVVPLLMFMAIFAAGYGTISLWIYFRDQEFNVLVRAIVLYVVGAVLVLAAIQLSKWLRS